MSASGGELANLPAIVASGVPAVSLYLIDASGIAADAGPPTVEMSRQATVEMNTTPTGGASAVQTSLFQTNSVALRATAWFGAQVLRSGAVAVITGINWG